MGSIYNRADIYDLFEDETRYKAYKKHWEAIFNGKDIKTMLDVSIGSGSVTLPVMELEIELSGSDLNESMLTRCRAKNEKNTSQKSDLNIDLKCSDFRDLSCWADKTFDLVASSGNSLGYVNNDDVLIALEQMDSHVKSGGFLYFDSRNWDKIIAEHQRFYFYNPMFDGDTRVNVIQVWDYNDDGSIIFNIIYTFERDNQIIQREIFEEHYHPVSKDLLINKLISMGYKDIEIKCFPAYFPDVEFEKMEWYSIIAKKGIKNETFI